MQVSLHITLTVIHDQEIIPSRLFPVTFVSMVNCRHAAAEKNLDVVFLIYLLLSLVTSLPTAKHQ